MLLCQTLSIAHVTMSPPVPFVTMPHTFNNIRNYFTLLPSTICHCVTHLQYHTSLCYKAGFSISDKIFMQHYLANTLLHQLIHCYTSQYTVTPANTLLHLPIHYYTSQYPLLYQPMHCYISQDAATSANSLIHQPIHCYTTQKLIKGLP